MPNMLDQIRRILLRGYWKKNAHHIVEKRIKQSDHALKQKGRKHLDRFVRALEDDKLLPDGELREIKERVFDFQMERGIARSEKGIKSLGHLDAAASFRRSMFHQYQRNNLYQNPLRPFFENKLLCYDFVDQIGVRRPKTFPAMTLEEVILVCEKGVDLPRYVVKPLDSCNSKGIFLIRSEKEIFQVKGSKEHHSFAELKKAMEKDLKQGSVEHDCWYIEEAITINQDSLKPARDLKFFSFYGRVGIVAEIDRTQKPRVGWWTADMKKTDGFWGFDALDGNGFTAEEIKMARSISRQIPLPYARIDFLKNEQDFVFGEIEVNTGGFEKFPRHVDRHLGRLYLEAENRLYFDLMAGKKFDTIWNVAEKMPVFKEYSDHSNLLL